MDTVWKDEAGGSTLRLRLDDRAMSIRREGRTKAIGKYPRTKLATSIL